MIARRLEQAKQRLDEPARRLLAQEDERWISLAQGTMLPGFLREPPPLFSVKAADQAVRVFLLGDFGFGDAAHPPENRV